MTEKQLHLTIVIFKQTPEDIHDKRLTLYHDQYTRFLSLSRVRWPYRIIVQACTLLCPVIPAPERFEDRWEPYLLIAPSKIDAILGIKRATAQVVD